MAGDAVPSVGYKDLTSFQQLQIDMAARGMISGSLSEWPVLYRTLQKLGYSVSMDVHALQAKKWCQEVLTKEGKWQA